MRSNILIGEIKLVFDGKTILITGGTGSLGKNLVRRIMTGEVGVPKKVIIFSRDEDKQYTMNLELKKLNVSTHDTMYRKLSNTIEFRIGDVKDYASLVGIMKDVNIVIHAAALKQVPTCEYFPYESVKTNILGSENVIKAVQNNGGNVETVLAISTDKACKPINTYGMCKAIQERLIIQANIDCKRTRFICVRYGNVIASRGSVIPLFKEQIRNGGPVTVTTNDMTRFWLGLDTAVDIIFDTLRFAKAAEIYVPDITSANIVDLASVMIGKSKIEIKTTGIRPGEKIHEILISEEEMYRTIKRGKYYVIYPILEELQKKPIKKIVLTKELSSEDCVMDKSELRSFLKNEGLLSS